MESDGTAGALFSIVVPYYQAVLVYSGGTTSPSFSVARVPGLHNKRAVSPWCVTGFAAVPDTAYVWWCFGVNLETFSLWRAVPGAGFLFYHRGCICV